MIHNRIEAARSGLAGLAGQAKEAFSRTQSLALHSLLRGYNASSNQKLTEHERATLSEEIIQVGFIGCDVVGPLTALSPSPGASREARKPMQNFLRITNYFDKGEWSTLLDASGSTVSKLAVVLDKAYRLGGRALDEHSLKMLTSLWLCCCFHNPIELTAIPLEQRMSYKGWVKDQILYMLRKGDVPDVWVVCLPHEPDSFRQGFPAMYAQAFGSSDGPVSPPMWFQQRLMQFDSTWKCRGTSTGGDPSGPGIHINPYRSNMNPMQWNPQLQQQQMQQQQMGQQQMQQQHMQHNMMQQQQWSNITLALQDGCTPPSRLSSLRALAGDEPPTKKPRLSILEGGGSSQDQDGIAVVPEEDGLAVVPVPAEPGAFN